MTATEISKAKSDIEATADLLERAMKLSGIISTLFQTLDVRLRRSFEDSYVLSLTSYVFTNR